MRFAPLFVIALFVCIASDSSAARDHHVNGYKVRLDYHHETNSEHQDMFVVSGSVSEGKSCKKLELLVAFGNHRHYPGYVPVASVHIDNYDSAAWNDFSGQVIFETDNKYLSTWGFKELEVHCLE